MEETRIFQRLNAILQQRHLARLIHSSCSLSTAAWFTFITESVNFLPPLFVANSLTEAAIARSLIESDSRCDIVNARRVRKLLGHSNRKVGLESASSTLVVIARLLTAEAVLLFVCLLNDVGEGKPSTFDVSVEIDCLVARV